jgi:ABC-type sugar transport system ATPase subunit
VTFLEEELQFSPYFLADDRIVHSDEYPPEAPSTLAGKPLRTDARSDIRSAMQRASNVLSHMAFGATNSGTANSNTIYLDVLRGLTRKQTDRPSPDVDLPELLDRLFELDEMTSMYSRFELMPRLDARQFISTIKRIDSRHLDIAEGILTPHLEGIQSRLAALQEVHRLISTLVDRTNEFLRDKELTFTVRRGLRVKAPNEEGFLSPTSLSSGERQLLLLMCNTIIARERAGLFLIDEPEISLNVTWQRTLLTALLELTQGTQVQFIVATHSIEMITPHRQSLVVLR